MADGSSKDAYLDNPVWHSLRGRLSAFAAPYSTTAVIHFDREVSMFSAVDRIDEGIWQCIAENVGLQGHCGLFRDIVPTPPVGWEEQFRGPCFQMLARDLRASSDLELRQLGTDDVPDMLALAKLTEPGPFLPRTFELGRYVGLRREGRLVAMAGERFRLPGFVEVSAVCTHPEIRREGLGGELTLNVAHAIRAGGDEAFLHVLESNENAIRLYLKLGFVIRRRVDVVFAQWHGSGWRAGAPIGSRPE